MGNLLPVISERTLFFYVVVRKLCFLGHSKELKNRKANSESHFFRFQFKGSKTSQFVYIVPR